MSKATTLENLEKIWHEQKLAKHKRTKAGAGYPCSSRWSEIFKAHCRRVVRRKRLRYPVARVASQLREIQIWAEVIRNNRNLAGLPPQVHRFGNSGQEKS